jgi:GNAT superfamily N-acetyltransferase
LYKKDLSIVIPLFVDAFVHPPWNYDWMTHEKAERYIRDLLQTPGFLGFVYVDAGRIAGVCLGCVNDYFQAVVYELKELAVAHTAQRKGIGSKMMAAIEGYLKAERGVEFVTLQTARHSPVYEFYLKNAYAPAEDNAFLMKGVK